MKSTRFSVLAQSQTLFPSEPSSTPKTQPNDSKAAVWLSFWCSTRPSADTGTDYYLLHYYYQEEEDEDKEEDVKEPQCAHPLPLDNHNVIGSN